MTVLTSILFFAHGLLNSIALYDFITSGAYLITIIVCRIGAFFCPLIPAMTALKLLIFFFAQKVFGFSMVYGCKMLVSKKEPRGNGCSANRDGHVLDAVL